MGARKMTFSIPEPLARELLRIVPSRERSNYVSEALAEKLRKQDEVLAGACDAANLDDDLLAMEREFDQIGSDIHEPWTNAPAR
jgi:hypothetical protein